MTRTPLFLALFAGGTTACGLVVGADFSNLVAADGGATTVADPDAAGSGPDGASRPPVDAGLGRSPGAGGADGSDADAGASSANPLCGNAAACVLGGIFTAGRVPSSGAGAVLPDGGTVAVVDDGFELGGATCDPSGTICVTGAITP